MYSWSPPSRHSGMFCVCSTCLSVLSIAVVLFIPRSIRIQIAFPNSLKVRPVVESAVSMFT